MSWFSWALVLSLVGKVYLQTTTRRTQGGELVGYLALAHNEGNERGVPSRR